MFKLNGTIQLSVTHDQKIDIIIPELVLLFQLYIYMMLFSQTYAFSVCFKVHI